MSDLAKSGTPSLATMSPDPAHQLTKNASTDMSAGDIVYLKSDDTFALTDGTALDAKSNWWGMINRSCKAGQPVTAFQGVEFRYATGLTTGTRYYLSTTPGALATAATTGGNVPTAFVTNSTNLYIIPAIR